MTESVIRENSLCLLSFLLFLSPFFSGENCQRAINMGLALLPYSKTYACA